MQTTCNQGSYIQDFGQKIGGAKKDLAQEQIQKLRLITNDALITQPLSKVLPKFDLVKMYNDKQITKETAVHLRYLLGKIPTKPRRTYSLKYWVVKVMEIVSDIRLILDNPATALNITALSSSEFILFSQEQECANWPQEEYNSGHYKIQNLYWSSSIAVVKGNRIFKRGTIQECVEWIKEKTGQKKSAGKSQYSVYRYNYTQEIYISPKGKGNIILKKGFTTPQEAYQFIADCANELECIYKEIRFIPSERRDWNRPRVGNDHRDGKDISPEVFSATFPFYGVEFGNWVNQIERASYLNMAYDALMDLSLAMEIKPEEIALNDKLSLAFGARGGGNASAHYELDRKVINLTKTKGDKGSLAHEWFHALDNHICYLQGSPLSMATEMTSRLNDRELGQAFQKLDVAIRSTDFYKRSQKCDECRSKKYWSTIVEMAARGFEKFVITTLDELGWHNDYLANIKTIEEYTKKGYYPYPTDEEIKLLAPHYAKIVACAFKITESELLDIA